MADSFPAGTVSIEIAKTDLCRCSVITDDPASVFFSFFFFFEFLFDISDSMVSRCSCSVFPSQFYQELLGQHPEHVMVQVGSRSGSSYRPRGYPYQYMFRTFRFQWLARLTLRVKLPN